MPIISLAKSRTKYEDNVQKYTPERIFLPHKEEPIDLEVGSPEYRIMTQVRDETHRFAVKYHRENRSRLFFNSALDNIQGLGPVRKKKLYEHFESLDKVREASLKEIQEVLRISPTLARSIMERIKSLSNPSEVNQRTPFDCALAQLLVYLNTP